MRRLRFDCASYHVCAAAAFVIGEGTPSIDEEWETSMTMSTGVLAGKRGLVVGVANSRSIAYGIAKQARAHGAELMLSYQGDALKKRVEPLAAERSEERR